MLSVGVAARSLESVESDPDEKSARSPDPVTPLTRARIQQTLSASFGGQPIRLVKCDIEGDSASGTFAGNNRAFRFEIGPSEVSFEPIPLEGSRSTRADAAYWAEIRRQFLSDAAFVEDSKGRKRCRSGYPCGNTCIANNRRCRITNKSAASMKLSRGMSGSLATPADRANPLVTKDAVGQAEQIEGRIRRQPREHLAVIGRDGSVLGVAKGDGESVEIPEHLRDKEVVGGAIITHNHPTGPLEADPRAVEYGLSFSEQDVAVASALNAGEIRATSGQYTYRIGPGSGPKGKSWGRRRYAYKIAPAYNKNRQRNLEKLYPELRRQGQSHELAVATCIDKSWEQTAEECGLFYRRERVK